MFVFPVLNSGYKSRKRVHRCCELCRIKRVKCDVSDPDFQVGGCARCKKNGLTCSFLQSIEQTRSASPQVYASPKQNEPLTSLNHNPKPVSSSIETFWGYSELPARNTKVDLQFLKRRFNFNAFLPLDSYQYMHPADPRAVFEETSNELDKLKATGILVADREQGPVKNFHIEDRRTVEYLYNLRAFTVSSPEFVFTDDEIAQLCDIYFFKINSIFPIVDETRFRGAIKESKAPTLQVLCLILVILRDKLAEPVLRQVFARSKNDLDNPKENSEEVKSERFLEDLHFFQKEIEGKIRQLLLILAELGEFDKISRLVVMLLLSMHFAYNRYGNEQASHDLCAAVNLGVSMGIHMKVNDDRFTREQLDHSCNLWWCCFIFDRFNALANGRCMFVDHEDFNLDLPYHHPTLLRMVQLARTLELFILLYRPFNISLAPPVEDIQHRLKNFNLNEFEALEFDYCDREIASKERIFSHVLDTQNLQSQLPAYVNIVTQFMTRIINNTAMLIAQKYRMAHLSVKNDVANRNSVRACANIVWYWKQLEDAFILNIPVFYSALLMALGIYMRLRSGRISEQTFLPGSVTPRYGVEEVLAVLAKHKGKWWVVDEIYTLSTAFVDGLSFKLRPSRHGSKVKLDRAAKTGPFGSRIRPLSDSSTPTATESTTSIQSLIHSPEAPPDGKGNVGRWDMSWYDSFFENIHFGIFEDDYFTEVPNLFTT